MSSAGQGRDLLDQASDRLVEAQGLIDAGSATATPQVPHTIESFTAQAQEGSDLLMSSYADSRDPATVASVREFAASSLARIEAMDATAPPEARGDLRAAALALRDIDARATRLCDTCADLPALAMPKVFLASAEVDRAMRRFEAAQPDNSHPVVAAKQDVRRAGSGATGGSKSTSGRTGSGADAVPSLPAAPKAPAPADDAPLPRVTVSPVPTPELSITADVNPRTITDGLGDTVETILPDVDTGGLLPVSTSSTSREPGS